MDVMLDDGDGRSISDLKLGVIVDEEAFKKFKVHYVQGGIR